MTNSALEIETIAFSITVADIEKSKRFYSEGLDFKLAPQNMFDIPAGSEDAKNMGLPGGAKLTTCFAWRPHMRIEISSYTLPKPTPGEVKPPNRTGMNALHFATTDVKALTAKLLAAGGTLIQEWGTERAVIADPDGIRINCAAVPLQVIRGIFGG